MKSIYTKILIFFILLISTNSFGQLLLNEHFNTASLPAGWTNTAMQSAKTWAFVNTPVFTTTSGGYYAQLLDNQPTTLNEAALISPAFDCTGRTSVKLQFEHFWDDVEQIQSYVEVSTDGGTVWTIIYSDIIEGVGDIGSYAVPKVTTVDLSAFVLGKSNVKLRFRFANEGSNAGKSWNIDDVVVYSDPDVSVISFDTPVYLDCTAPYTNAELVTMRIKNYSIFPVSNIPYTVDIIGGITMTLTGTYAGPLLPGDTAIITFPSDLLDMTADDQYGFTAYTTLATDAYLNNDTIITSRRQWVTNYDHVENFNLTSEGWKRGGGDSRNYWKWGNVPYLGGNESQGKSWYLVRDGSSTYTSMWLESPVFDLSSLVNPILTFDIKYDLSYDWCNRSVYIEYTKDNGVTWTTLGTNTEPEWYESGSNSCRANSWSSGTNTSYTTVQHDLCNLFGETCVKFRMYAYNTRYSDQFTFDNFTISDFIDVGVTAFLRPVNIGCTYSSTQDVQLRVYNSTCSPISNVPVKCDISGAITQTLAGSVPGPIPSGESRDYTLPSTFDMTTVGVYTFTSYTDEPTDEKRSNDTLIRSLFASFTKVSTFPYTEDFESGAGNWQAAGGDATNFWTMGVLPYLNGDEGNGTSWYLSRDGSSTRTDVYLNSPVFDFRENTKPILSFDIKYDLTYEWCNRGVYVQSSTDGGVSWQTVGSAGADWYNAGANSCWSNTWSAGTLNTWAKKKTDLCYLSGESCVKLRIICDNVIYSDKFAIDNIRIDAGTGDDIRPLEIYPTHSGTCTGFSNTEIVGVLLENNTCRPLTNIPIQLDMTGAGTKTILDTIPGPIYRFSRYFHIFQRFENKDFTTALDFDGTDDYILVNDATAFDFTNATYEAWIKPDNLAGGWHTIIDLDSDVQLLGLYGSSFNIYGRCGNQSFGTAVAGEWQHIAWVISGTSYSVYLNGILIGTGNTCSGSVNVSNLVIGGGLGVNELFDGQIDEVRIWNTARTASEIQANMLTNLTGAEPGLVAYYTMEDGTGSSVLTDNSAPAVNGVLTNMDNTTDWVTAGTAKIYFDESVDMTAPGTYDLQVISGDNNNKGIGLYWSAINDTSVANNTYSQNRYNSVINTYPHISTFDASNEGWASHPLDILRRYWHCDAVPYLGGAQGQGKSWYMTTDGSSAYNDLWVESPTYDLTGLVNPMLSFDLMYSLGYEWCNRIVYLQYSKDGGTNWTTLGTNADPEWYNCGSNTCRPSTWSSGTVNTWSHVQHSLCDLIGESCVKFRFYCGNVRYGDVFAFDNFEVLDVVDARMMTYLAPYDSGCLFGADQQVIVTVYNFSCNPINNIPITCDIEGPNPTTLLGTVTDLIPAGSTISYSFPSTFDMITTGTYDFTTYIHIPDWRAENDSIRYSVNVNQLSVSTFPYTENFNLDDGLWVQGGGNGSNYWEWGTLSYLNGSEGNGDSWYIVRDGSSTYTDQWLISPVFDFSKITNPTISFDVKYDLSYEWCNRGVYVQYSTDGGTSWSTLGTSADTSWYNAGTNTCWSNSWSAGTLNTWTRMSHYLCEVSGQRCVKIRIYADNMRYSDKFAIDNVVVSDGGGDDIETMRIYNPDAGDCAGYTNSELVGVLLQNNTCRTLTNLPIKFEMTGARTETVLDTVPGPINRFGRYYHVFQDSQDNDLGISLNFDGTNDFVLATDATAFDFTDVTFEAWIKPANLAGGWHTIIDLDNDQQLLSLNGSSFSIYGRCGSYSFGTAAVGEWQHVAWVISGTSYSLYVNGILIGSGNTCSPSINVSNLVIGSGFGGNEFFTGQIDEVRIWSTARTAGEIQSNMLTSLTGTEPGLRAYYTMENGTGSGVVSDMSTNSYTGTLTNMSAADAWIYNGTIKVYSDHTIDMSTAGNYNLTIETGSNISGRGTNYINDLKLSNNTITENRYFGKINTFPYTEDFESGNSNWASAPLNILRKYWDIDTLKVLNGEQGNGNSWFLSSDGSSNYDDCWVESPIFDFSSLVSPMVSFDIKYDIAYEWCRRAVHFDYSTDGGTNWTRVGTNSDPDWFNSGANTCWIDTWSSGTVNSWTHVRHTLCDLVGNPCVKFRFYANDVRYNDVFAFDNFDIREMIDVGVTAHVAPTYQGCLQTSNTPIIVTVYNGSCSPMTDIPIVCEVSGVLNKTILDTMRTTVPVAGFLNFTFNEKIDMLPVGNYSFTSYTNFPGEIIRTNDTTIGPTINVPHTYIDYLPYSEDFNANSGAGTWQPGGGNASNYWTWGTVPYLAGASGHGNSWYMVRDGSATYTDMWVESPVYDFTNLQNPILSLDLMYDLSYEWCNRGVYITYSINGGSSWTTLGSSTDEDWYTCGSNTCWSNSWSAGTRSYWQNVTKNLCSLKGNSCVMFRIYGDNMRYSDKFAFDNFRIEELPLDLEMISIYGCYGYLQDVQLEIKSRDEDICKPYELGVNIAKIGRTATFNNMDNADWVIPDLPTNNGFSAGCGAGLTTSLNFDGINDYVSSPSNSVLTNKSFTIEIWAKRSVSGQDNYIISQGSASNNTGLSFGFKASNVFTFGFWGNDLNTVTTYTDNQWHHWAGTYNATTNERNIYRDGAIVASDIATADYSGTGSFNIGRLFNGTNYFTGDMDEVRIWDIELSSVELLAGICENPKGSETGLAIYYNMEDGTGNNLTDITGGPITGVGSASASHVSSPASQAFDGDNITYGWGNNNSIPSWLQYDFGAGNSKIIQLYRIYCGSAQTGGWGSENYNPKTWTFEASNDASTWVVLNTVPNGWLTMNTWKDFEFTNTTPYRYYRLNMTAAESGSWLHITELELYEDVTRFPPPITELDLSYSINGGVPVTTHITGLDIKGGQIEQVILPNVLIPDALSEFKVWLSNPNGIQELINNNDTITADLNMWPGCNDHCIYATEILSTITHASQTTNATDDPTEDPAFACTNPGPDAIPGNGDDLAITVENTVWYWFTTDCDGGDVEVKFKNIHGTACSKGIQVSIDKLEAEPACEPANYTNVFCDYPNNTSNIIWTGTALGADEIYYITVDGVANGQCDFEIEVTGSVGFDPAHALAGTYEINTTNVNYPTFQAAFDSLKIYGVKAPVIFRARDTIYNEQLELSGICGVNEDTTVTFTSICDDCARPKVQFNAESYSFLCGQDFANSLFFDGSNDYVIMNLDEPETEITHELWFKTSRASTGIFGVGSGSLGSTGNDRQIYLQAGEIKARVFNNEVISSSGKNYADGKWHHLAHVIGASVGGQKLYVDGVLVASGTKTASAFTTQTQIYFGYSNDMGYFRGEIDEVRIRNVALTEAEIIADMCKPLTGAESGLLAYYNLDDGLGSSTAADITGNGITGTLTNMNINTNWIANNITETKVFNTTLDFDGTNDYVITTHTTAFDFTSVTFEAWINPSSLPGGWHTIIDLDNDRQLLSTNGSDFAIYGRCGNVTFPGAVANIWQHIAFSISGTSYSLYQNGILIGSGNTCAASIDVSNLMIGSGLGGNEYFPGKIDNVRIWNTARTQQEIRDNMYSELTGSEPGLVAYYKMEDGTGSGILNDNTANNLDGTLTNMDPGTDWLTTSDQTYCDAPPVSASYDNFTMKLNGAKFYNFDRIDFGALDPNKSIVVELESVHNITFNDCIFTGDLTLSDNTVDRTLIHSVGISQVDTLSFTNCEFIGGSYGIQLENTLNTIDEVNVTNNKFSNQSVSAVSFLKHKNPKISFNEISSNSLRNDYVGISLTEITGALRVQNNILLDSLSDGTAILLDNATSTAGSEGLIANNMIRFGSADADASYGITLQNASSYQKVYHNSINLTSNAGSALNINGLDFGDVRNNIFNSSANSATVAGETNFTEGYNAFNPDYALKGTGSIFQNPGFISLSDLHTEEALLKAGTPLSITTDIDGEGRNAVTPFMGADEFLGLVSWTGAVNKDWNNTGNWSSGQIPTRGTTVEIPLAVPNFPEINSKSSKLAEVRNITIHNGAHLYIEPIKYLTTYKNFTNNGEFLIKSDANGTGSFIPKTTPGTIAGTGTNKMQLFLTQNRWHYVASPITTATGIFSEYYYWWDETIKDRWYHNDFVDWTWDGTGTPTKTPTIMGWTLASGQMDVGEGYAYWFRGANKTVTFNGVFNSGDYEVSLDFTDQGGDAVQDIYDGWNLLANPYPSTINWNSDGITLTNVDNAVYVYSDDGSKSYDNYYYYMKGVSNSPYPLIALNASDDSCHIAPGQSVFVRANATGAKVKITNQARQHRVSTFYKSGEKHPNLLKLSAEHSGNTDELAIRFIPEASSGYDGEYDAIKRYSSSGKVPQISSQINAGELAINTLSEITDGLVIPLSFAAGESGKYSIKEMELNFEPNVNIYLIDKYLRKRIRLNDTPEYSFKIDAGNYKDRFYIVFKLEKSLTEENPEESLKIDELLTENVKIFAVKKSVNIKFENVQGNDNQVIVQDVLGKQIIHQKLISDNTVLPMENFAAGNYIVKVITKNKVYEQKVFIK